ncbi:universal stress protein [Streptomyces sp. NPDC018947]|uniref:universal stress protein n=1 Tax=Streptomyces sp. NPDC018947 TaxID=3365054 RepID=UPI0037BB9BE9
MYLPVVVGVDGSESSLGAVDWATGEADLHGVALRIVYASLWERYEGAAFAREFGGPAAQVTAEDVLAAAVRRARRARGGLPVTTAVVREEPEYVLLRESRNASLLVVGSRGRGGFAGLVLGSVGLTVATRADCPVVVIRDDHDDAAVTGRHGRIVVGVADTPTAAVRFACAEARRRDAVLEAVRAWRGPARETAGHPPLTGGPERLYEERAAKELDAALAGAPGDVTLRRRVVEGPARRVLLDVGADADLLAVGRRRSRHLGPHLGRVAHTVLHHRGCPVVIVPDDD